MTQHQQNAYAGTVRQANGETTNSSNPLGSHPVETGLGAVAGGAIGGAVAGSVAGPLGTAAGAIAGAVLGAAAGKGVATVIDPEEHDRYWRDNHARQPYYDSTYAYEDYGPAYRYGVSAYQRYPDRSFDEVEADLHRDWGTAKGTSRLEWEHARHASRDAWIRASTPI